MKFSELKGRAVISLEDATKIGEVEDLLVEADGHHIVKLKVRTGLFHASKTVPVGDVRNVGADAVTIAFGANPAGGPAATNDTLASDGAPATADEQSSGVEKASGDQTLIEISTIFGNKVVTDAGTLVGELSDVMVDWVDLTITGYEVREGGLFGKAHEFLSTPEVRYGNKIITIPAQLLNQPK